MHLRRRYCRPCSSEIHDEQKRAYNQRARERLRRARQSLEITPLGRIWCLALWEPIVSFAEYYQEEIPWRRLWSSYVVLPRDWTIRPVEVDGAPQLYDIFDPAGQWHGSRRTIAQCREYITQGKAPPPAADT